MGHVIRVDNEEGSTQPVLTETGTGRLLSSGYLRDKPAMAYLEDDETPVFVLTNGKRGVEIAREEGTEQITSGSGYRTIAVVTDRRLVIVVGDSTAASVDGDQCLSVQLVDVEGVSADSGRRGGQLTVVRASGGRLTVHSGTDGLDEAAAYVTAASQAWIHVENTLDDVKRSLVTATSHCDAGEYDAALEAAREAYHGLNEPRRTANQFDSEWTASAMIARVDQIQQRCAGMLAEVRLGRARRFSDDAESHWRDDEFEAAHDAYERAQEELEAVLTYDSAAVQNRDEVHEEIERVERVMEELEKAPLRRAVEADRAASDADDPVDAAPHWEDALEAYRVVLELDWGADERRFAGEPDQIRDRLGEVVERLVSARRSAATKAKRAGDWYVGAEQYEVAIEEFETARDQYDLALAVARDRYPDATDHLTVERDAVDERIERARAMRDGESVGPVATPDDEVGQGPGYDFEETIGDGGAVVDASSDSTEEDGETKGDETRDGEMDGDVTAIEPDIETRLRRMDEAAFTDVVLRVLSETGWTTTMATSEDDHDIEATKETPADERMLVRVAHRPDGDSVDRSTVDDCASLRRDRSDAGAVMVATSGSVTSEATRHARQRQVRLLDDECLSAIIESREMEDLLVTRRIQAGYSSH